MNRPGEGSRLVYSTDGGRITDERGMAARRPGAQAAPIVPNDGIVRIQRDKKGRGGKTATTVTGLPGSEADLDALLKALKQQCGTGGSREGRTLVLQGDQRERLLERMLSLGYKAKLAGG
jgi:translation initiation factor 1